jgi:hypothetical protein
MIRFLKAPVKAGKEVGCATPPHGNIVRFADDFVLGFQYRSDARLFRIELQQRLAKFGLELHPEKTRLIEFGRFATGDL